MRSLLIALCTAAALAFSPDVVSQVERALNADPKCAVSGSACIDMFHELANEVHTVADPQLALNSLLE